jgi:hypothetical protein
MKNLKNNKREISKQITIMDFDNTKHVMWNRRRRFGL